MDKTLFLNFTKNIFFFFFVDIFFPMLILNIKKNNEKI